MSRTYVIRAVHPNISTLWLMFRSVLVAAAEDGASILNAALGTQYRAPPSMWRLTDHLRGRNHSTISEAATTSGFTSNACLRSSKGSAEPLTLESFMSREVGSPVERAPISPHESSKAPIQQVHLAHHRTRPAFSKRVSHTENAFRRRTSRLAAAPTLEHHSAIVAPPPHSFFGFGQSAAR
eukprot:671285-Prymnesium_polylepis.1